MLYPLDLTHQALLAELHAPPSIVSIEYSSSPINGEEPDFVGGGGVLQIYVLKRLHSFIEGI